MRELREAARLDPGNTVFRVSLADALLLRWSALPDRQTRYAVEFLLDGTREGDAAPRPPQLTELLPLPGRPGLNSPQRTPLRA